MFSRHISKNVKNIQLKIYELQDLYKFKFDLQVNLDKIIVKIFFNKDTEKYILNLVGQKTKTTLFPKYQVFDYKEKYIKVTIDSVS
jgi:hypothetical protein